jgi:5-methylcytosine-specific restriction enzyme subunit McrC
VKIPIKNLFYLLCYAWDVLEEGEVTEVGTVEAPDLENLMASVVTRHLERLLRRGLDRDYEEKREDSICIRGRIDFQETTKRFLRRRGATHVVFDELSPDTLANRILKETLRSLLRFETLSTLNREELAGLYRGLREVSDIRISTGSFYRVRLHRNNQDYRLLLSICEMIQRYALPQEQGQGMRFVNFTRKQMWKLFQLFVTNFYRRKQSVYSVNPDAFPWFFSQSPEVERFSLPELATDIVLSSPTAQIVIDTKFYPKPFEIRYDKSTVRSGHLNQMFAYMENVAARDSRRRQVGGVILYAAVSSAFQQDWRLFGHDLRVAAVDLSKDWMDIEKSLLSIIGINQPEFRSFGPLENNLSLGPT